MKSTVIQDSGDTDDSHLGQGMEIIDDFVGPFFIFSDQQLYPSHMLWSQIIDHFTNWPISIFMSLFIIDSILLAGLKYTLVQV